MTRLSKKYMERLLGGVKDISLYLHIPFCASKCSYCAFYSLPNPDREVVHNYFHTLSKDISFILRSIPENSLSTIYIGGGTPSLFSEEIVSFLHVLEREVLRNRQTCEEYTLEVNPGDIHKNLLAELEQTPINRLSVGIQSTQKPLLKRIGRGTSDIATETALHNLRDFWDKKLSLDLLCGIPGQTKSMIEDDFAKILKIFPEHISLYQLSVEEGTPLYDIYQVERRNKAWSPEVLESLQLFGESLLESFGYFHYEVSSFSSSSASVSKHNMRYWNMRPYFGIGPSAGSTLPDPDKPGYPMRMEFPCNLDSWFEMSEEEIISFPQVRMDHLKGPTFLFEYLLMHFRTYWGISKNNFFQCFGIQVKELLPEGIRFGLMQGYMEEKDIGYYVTKRGFHFLNSLLMTFLDEIQCLGDLLINWP